MGAILDVLEGIGSGIDVVVNFIVSLIAAAGNGLAAFFTGGIQLYNQIFSAFDGLSGAAPLSLFAVVASVGIGYIAARILINLL